MLVEYKVFQSGIKSWDKLFDEAAAFATEVGPRKLIGISHSEGRGDLGSNGVITVWYWTRERDDA